MATDLPSETPRNLEREWEDYLMDVEAEGVLPFGEFDSAFRRLVEHTCSGRLPPQVGVQLLRAILQYYLRRNTRRQLVGNFHIDPRHVPEGPEQGPDDFLADILIHLNTRCPDAVKEQLRTSPAFSLVGISDVGAYYQQIDEQREYMVIRRPSGPRVVVEEEERERPSPPARGPPATPIEIGTPATRITPLVKAQVGVFWTNLTTPHRKEVLSTVAALSKKEDVDRFSGLSYDRLPAFLRTALESTWPQARDTVNVLEEAEEEAEEAPAPPVTPPVTPPPAPTPHVPLAALPLTNLPPPLVTPPRRVSEAASLAQRFRPCLLSQVIGHPALVNQLRGAIRTNVLGARGAGVILWGPPGVGKTTVAHAFARDYFIARGVLAASPENPCPELPAEFFTEITAYRVPIDPAMAATYLSGLLQETMRMGTLFPSSGAAKRVILLDDYNEVPKKVQDRLKPLLERYTGNAILMFTMNTDPAGTFDPAILSRSLVVHVPALSPTLIQQRLRQVATEEKIAFPGLEDTIAKASQLGDLGAALGALQDAYNSFLGSQP